MKNVVFLFLFGLSLLACADIEPLEFDPLDASQVTGVWYQHPDAKWVWIFDGNGLLTQKIYDFNTTIWTNESAYWTKRDTLRFRDFNGGNVKTFTVKFSSPDTFEIQGVPIGIKNKLIRF